ncbi:hypothetical protein Neosp_012860 [[Neocosmospora] mangrovei]
MASGIDAEAPHNNFDTILVLDFGSQTSHLILRRLRALSVYAEMLPCTTKLADLTWKPKGIVLSGEYGHADVTIHKVDNNVDRLFAGLGETMHAYMSHFDKLVRLPEGFVVVAKTANSEFAGIAHQSKPIFGVQFHPELEHTPRGSELLRNFSVDICGAQPSWVMSDFIEQEIARIRKLVGDKAQVIGAVSGGVDSTVAAKLMKEAIGLMRLNECEQVKETLQQHLGINLTVVDGAELFLGRLKGIREPEKKRKIIGETFIDLFEKEAVRIEKEAENTPNAGKVSWFLQGTRITTDDSKAYGPGIGMSQAYAGLDTNKAVGVMGDTRVYGYIVILRAVTTSDFMSAEPYEFSFKLLKAMARRIVNEVDGVSRVTYDLSSKPPGTIELE